MSEDGETKDDVKMPDSGEVAEKINKLFKVEEKDTSKFNAMSSPTLICRLTRAPQDVVILTAMGEEAAIDAKEAPRGS